MNRRLALILLVTFLATNASAQVRIKVDSSSLDFGGMSLISKKDLTIEITDTTQSDFIQIDKITPSGPAAGDFKITSPQSFPIVLVPGNNPQPVIIEFTPKLLGSRTADLVIQTSDGQLSIPMKGLGTGEQSQLELSLTSIDFGTVAPNTQRDTVIYLRSMGPDSATVTGLQMQNSGNDVFYDATLRDSKLQFPFKVAAGDSLAIDIRFHGILPEDEKDGLLTIFGNASSPPSCALLGFVHYGTYSLSLPRVDFGSLYEGEIKDATVSITNDGNVDISVDAIQSVAEDFSLLNPPAIPFMIPAGRSYDLVIRANPQFGLLSDWQLQVNSFSAIPTLRQSGLHVTVLPMPLKAPSSQQTTYLCASPDPVTVTIPISNTGVRSYSVTGMQSNDPNVKLTTDKAMPISIAAGGQESLGVTFDPSIVHHDTLVIALLGGERIILLDTIVLIPQPVIAQTHMVEAPLQSDSSIAVVVLTAGTTLPQPMSRLIEHIVVADTDVASIDASTFRLDPTITTGSLVVSSDGSGGYIATINATSPFTLTAGSAILSYRLTRFVARHRSTEVTAQLTAPEFSQCITFAPETNSISGWNGCGAASESDAMNGVPLLFSIHVVQNPVANDVLRLKLDASQDFLASFTIRDALGRAVSDRLIAVARGEHEAEVPLDGQHAKSYFLTLTTPDGARHTARFIKN